MKRINNNELQQIQLEILKKVASYCDKNKLKYYLCYGTLLGAVTKKGFRNQYSDIDIVMFREDYDKFCQNFNFKDLKLLDCRYNDYYYAYAKVVNTKTVMKELKTNIKDLGVYIDIMPIDYIPDNYIKRKIYIIKNYILERLLLLKRGAYLDNYNFLVKIIYKIGSILIYYIPSNFFSKKINNIRQKNSKKYNNKIILSFINIIDKMDKDIFNNRIKLDFEKYSFYAPKEYTKCLNVIFGNYQKAKIRNHHNHIEAYWK